MSTLEDLGRQKLKELLSQCTDGEVNIFNRMYGSVEEIKLSQMDWAIQQCERTIEKHS